MATVWRLLLPADIFRGQNIEVNKCVRFCLRNFIVWSLDMSREFFYTPCCETIYKNIALFLRFFLSHFFASWCYSNTENQTRFSTEYGLSVGSKCNSLKTNQAFKNKLGCPRPSYYLTPPPTRYVLGRCPRIKRSKVHVQPVSLKWLASVWVFFFHWLYLIILVKFGLIFLYYL